MSKFTFDSFCKLILPKVKNMREKRTSRIQSFYKQPVEDRMRLIQEWATLDRETLEILSGRSGFSLHDADNMIENVVGTYTLPFGIGTNFLINNKDYLIPMVIEEPSVVAAVSNAAKLFRSSGGFKTRSDPPIMIGQIQVLDIPDIQAAVSALEANKNAILAEANKVGGSIVRRGGGAVEIETRIIPNTPIGPMLILHLLLDTRDAMGANAVNTAVEFIAPMIEKLTGGRINLRILSNLTDRRKAYATGMIPADELKRGELSGRQVARAIVEAGIFAEVDPYRAATHNKGIMNGIDAVIIATGNDWRAIEAGAHAYAARDGQYRSLTRWWQDEEDNLHGSIEIPLAVGIVGGATRVHPTAQIAMKILDIKSAQELAEVIAAVGLAQNFAAMRALATDGIQQGHMRMHARQLAVAAGAKDGQVATVVQRMIEEQNIRLERAKELVKQLTEDQP